MGMGYAAAQVEEVKEELIKQVAGKEYDELIKAIEAEDDMTIGDFAQEARYEEYFTETLENLYNKLVKKFNKETGLELYIGYHDAEAEGSRYDDIDGVYWCVGGVYQLTPAGKKYEKFIETKNFVNFG